MPNFSLQPCPNCKSPPASAYEQTCQVCGTSLTSGNTPNIAPKPSNPNVNAPGYCGNCGTPLAAKYAPCPNCGHVKTTFGAPPPAQANMQSPLFKSTATTVVLALVLGIFGICGVGHFYIGKISRGVVLLIIGIILGIIVFASMGIGLIIFLPFLGWTVYDAHKSTEYYNNFVSSNNRTPW